MGPGFYLSVEKNIENETKGSAKNAKIKEKTVYSYFYLNKEIFKVKVFSPEEIFLAKIKVPETFFISFL